MESKRFGCCFGLSTLEVRCWSLGSSKSIRRILLCTKGFGPVHDRGVGTSN